MKLEEVRELLKPIVADFVERESTQSQEFKFIGNDYRTIKVLLIKEYPIEVQLPKEDVTHLINNLKLDIEAGDWETSIEHFDV